MVRETGRLGEDPELTATFPGFPLVPGAHDSNGARILHSAQIALPENGFQVAGPANRSRYVNPELDAVIDTYYRTIRRQERIPLLGRVAQHMADQLPVMGIYYTPTPDAHGNRLLSVGTLWAGEGAPASTFPSWNAHEWDVP